jgi:ribonucleoside-diphosphate reductase subunit M2
MATIIRPTTPVHHVVPEATPSKKVSNDRQYCSTSSQPAFQAAAALQAISLESPTKPIQKPVPVIDDTRRSPSPLSETEKTEDQELDVRKRFVGDVDLPESRSANCASYLFSCPITGQEPLLMESKRRFVLFPIQYHEVIFFFFT